jgi:hypothetical protein
VQRYKKIFTKFNFDNIRTSINNFTNVATKNKVKITNVIIKNILYGWKNKSRIIGTSIKLQVAIAETCNVK